MFYQPSKPGLLNKQTASLQTGKTPQRLVQSAGAVEYADCVSADRQDPSTTDPVGWSCSIHRLHLCRRARPPQQVALSAGAVEYTDCISVDGQDPLNELPSRLGLGAVVYTDCISVDGQDSSTSIQIMTRNNLMVRLQ